MRYFQLNIFNDKIDNVTSTWVCIETYEMVLLSSVNCKIYHYNSTENARGPCERKLVAFLHAVFYRTTR